MWHKIIDGFGEGGLCVGTEDGLKWFIHSKEMQMLFMKKAVSEYMTHQTQIKLRQNLIKYARIY